MAHNHLPLYTTLPTEPNNKPFDQSQLQIRFCINNTHVIKIFRGYIGAGKRKKNQLNQLYHLTNCFNWYAWQDSNLRPTDQKSYPVTKQQPSTTHNNNKFNVLKEIVVCRLLWKTAIIWGQLAFFWPTDNYYIRHFGYWRLLFFEG